MGQLNYNSGMITQFEVETVEEEHQNLDNLFKVVHLTVISEYHSLKYRVSGDANYTIDHIERRLREAKNIVMSSDASIGITEYLERSYIYVNYPDGEMEKYTAQRLS